MKKRYIKFKWIPVGKFVPVGTTGVHYAVVELVDSQKRVTGSKAGIVTLNERDTLGYDCGKVWRVPRPDEYKE